jgi:hypothetical protein
MLPLDVLGRHVSRKIKIRGREYFENKAVRIVYADTEFASAKVSGSREYEVDLEREQDSLVFSCDCPYFEENLDVCKHVWATILELERQGTSKSWGPKYPVNLVPTEADPYVDVDDDADDLDIEDEEDFRSPDAFPGQLSKSSHPFPSPASGSWQQLLSKVIRQRDTRPAPPVWATTREILYVLEPRRQSSGLELLIQIDVRDRNKNGTWKKQKPLMLSHEILPLLPDSADREILSRLTGVKRETWQYGPFESTYRFSPANHDLKTLLPLMSRTGRFYLRASEAADLHPARWDEAGPFEFRIDVRPDPLGRQYEVRGTFHRGGEQLGISQADHVFREAILVLGEMVSCYDGPYDWIQFFRREGSFFVPYSETDQWLETMLGMPSLPRMDLPQELELKEMLVEPRPFLHVRTQKPLWGPSYIAGLLYFDYAGHTIAEINPASGIALVSERRRILRNREAETRARQRLEEAGFRRQRDFRNQDVWMITQSRLPAVVPNLVADGWKVEADGKLFRNPDALSFRISSGMDWFELHGDVEYGNTRVSIPRLLAALKRRENTILLDDGSYGMLPEEWLNKYGMLVNLGTAHEDHVRFNRNQAGLLDALLAAEPEASCDELFAHMRDELRAFDGVSPADPPPGFHGLLRPYQRTGLGWIHFLNRFGFGGCLADDMGLGKTIQVLALLEERRTHRESGGSASRLPPSLVVMPRSLVFNWLREAERFTPGIRILDHTGGERIRSHEHFDDYDAVLTTYGTLRRDAPFFKEKVFDYIILDEAQAIKNSTTESAKAARLLRGNHRLALSGTPIENHLGELWSLFEFLNPGMLGSVSVFNPGKGTNGKSDQDNRALLSHALRPFILRRTKAQVARDLPSKIEQTLYCELETRQRELYDELRNHYRRTLLERIERDGMQKSRIHVLEALLRLRQAAIHPGLIDRSRVAEPSAKLDMLLPQLFEVLDEGHKALVFSQFTSMLGILRSRLDEEKIRYEYLDGRTTNREIPVERFQNDPDSQLFLISLKAGGLGLNLTAAEYVYLLDPWWNPAVEAQAVDRTHRIGQTQTVFAYRLIAKDTVEEKVLALQATKRDIADAIINQDNSLMRNLSSEDLALLLS